jgi:NAD+ synthase
MNLRSELTIDPQAEATRIQDFLVRQVDELGKDGAVLGLSGGLDSSVCAYLCARALGKDKVLALVLPERDSSRVNLDHAYMVAQHLGLRLETVDLSSVLEHIGVYQLFSESERTDPARLSRLIALYNRITSRPSIFATGTSFLYGQQGTTLRLAEKLGKRVFQSYIKRFMALTIAKVRLRMLVLYYHAALNNHIVVGTTDKTEWTIGFYDRYGDGANDVALLRHLYKTQIKTLADYLGVAQVIVQKPSSADLLAGLPNELLIGVPYEQLDQILLGMELQMGDADMAAEAGVSVELVSVIRAAIAVEQIRMSLPRHL